MNGRIEQAEVRFVAAGNRSLGSIHAFHERKALYRSDTEALLSVCLCALSGHAIRGDRACYRDLAEIGGLPLETAAVLRQGHPLRALARRGQSGMLGTLSSRIRRFRRVPKHLGWVFSPACPDEQSSSAALARDGSAQYHAAPTGTHLRPAHSC